MKEFALVFRRDSSNDPLTVDQDKDLTRQWENWLADLVAKGKFIPGKRLGRDGKVLRGSGMVTDGPFVEMKEQLGGFMCMLADNIEEATAFARGCPILAVNGSVEVRPVVS